VLNLYEIINSGETILAADKATNTIVTSKQNYQVPIGTNFTVWMGMSSIVAQEELFDSVHEEWCSHEMAIGFHKSKADQILSNWLAMINNQEDELLEVCN